MMSAESSIEKAATLALNALSASMYQVAHDQVQTLDEKMKTLQWIYQKIPQINRLLIEIKTKKVNITK